MIVTVFAGSMKNTLPASDTKKIFAKAFRGCAGFSPVIVSDGGDGFLDAIKSANPSLKEKKIDTLSADMKKIKCRVLVSETSAYIESSLSAGKAGTGSSILMRSTKGLGILIKKLYDGKRKIFIGIGGTMTADIGYGMLEALGLDVSSHSGTSILKRAAKTKKYPLLYGVSDVNSPLNGKNGATLYLKQKGASRGETIFLNAVFDETAESLGIEDREYMGSGGGIGAAIFLAGGKVVDNFAFMDKIIKIKKRIRESDAVAVNEGRFDIQSVKGKITGRIVKEALESGKKAFVISGSFEYNLKKAKLIKVNTPECRNKINYAEEFEKAAIKTKELIYG